MTRNYLHLAAGFLALALMRVTAVGQTSAGGIESGVLPERWLTGGPKCMEMPEWQVHEYNPRLFILRQSGCTDYEKPFLYLLFGSQQALLLDTGSVNGNLAPTVQRIVHRWLLRNERDSIALRVVHTHGHGDHVAGDQELIALKDPKMPVTLIPATLDAERAAFHIQHWPEEAGSIDLGERVVDVIPIPGHSDTSVAYYDRKTGVLFPGDSLYPGRLYIRDFPAFQKSTERLVRFTAHKPVTHILGNHIEQMRTPFVDYPTGTMYQPDEHELALSRGALLELADALTELQGSPRRVRLRDFTLWPKATAETERAAEEKDYQEVNGRQRKHMWDQTAP
jgi:glyoxylase-like metal-dependent hydrolase (beta-lactamase superfamily II)